MLAVEALRNLGQVRFRDLDEKAEDIVVANLERIDLGGLALTSLQLGNKGSAALLDLPELVEFGVEARSNGAAVAGGDWGLLGKRLSYQFRDILKTAHCVQH